MAHEIESMIYNIKEGTPWHDQGVSFSGNLTTREAMKLAKMDWTVGKKKVFTEDGIELPYAATYRMDKEGPDSILGLVTKGWEIFQNLEAFAWFDPFIESGQAFIDTAASLRGGKRIFIQCKLNLSPLEIIKGDEVEKRLLLAVGHDGTMRLMIGLTPLRVVCANTLAMALGSASSKIVKIQHRKNIAATAEKVRGIINTANMTFEANAEVYQQLAKMPITADSFREYVKLVFKPETTKKQAQVNAVVPVDSIEPQNDPNYGERVFPIIEQLAEVGKGTEIAGVKGTWWGAYNALNEYLGYVRGKSQDARVDSYLFGDSAKINDKALNIAMQMAG